LPDEAALLRIAVALVEESAVPAVYPVMFLVASLMFGVAIVLVFLN
jgi:hypothetical protein